MKPAAKFIVVFLILALFLIAEVTADDSQCAACHTSGRLLIQTTREIADEIGEQHTESPESVGEG